MSRFLFCYTAYMKKHISPYKVSLYTCPAIVPFVFARHPWFVVEKQGIQSRWEVFRDAHLSKHSWGHIHKNYYSATQGIEIFSFSQKYFWKDVRLESSIDGNNNSVAQSIIECIEQSPEIYPYRDHYGLRGPNSNTYVQWILNQFPMSGLTLPWNSLGKNYVRLS